MKTPFWIRRVETRAQWLAKCHPAWREQLEKIEQGPREIAKASGVNLSTVRRHLRDGDIGRGGQYAVATGQIVGAVLRFQGFSVNVRYGEVERSDVDPEGRHLWYATNGELDILLKSHSNYWTTTANPQAHACRFCTKEQREKVRAEALASLRRQALAVLELRNQAAGLNLTPHERVVVYTALSANTAAASELLKGLRRYGLDELARELDVAESNAAPYDAVTN